MAIAIARAAASQAQSHRHIRRPSSRNCRIAASFHNTEISRKHIAGSELVSLNAYLDFTRLAHQTTPTRLAMSLDATLPHNKAVIAPALRGVVPCVLRRYTGVHHIGISGTARDVRDGYLYAKSHLYVVEWFELECSTSYCTNELAFGYQPIIVDLNPSLSPS